MKFYCTTIIAILLFSSCLKQSIPDAMLGKHGGGTATLSYEFNGEAVNISVPDADNQMPGNYKLACTKSGFYYLEAIGGGEFAFTFFTDSLTVGNYKYTSGDIFVTDYNNHPSFVHYPGDNINFNITSYSNGHISGNFSGVLTPLITPGTPDIYGTQGSVLITNGSFENVPVFY
ncbi:hypothetical protein FRZ67_16860 [Panacibacter ginsenosidivorans]|uniref:Uncharacterized protein n=1 Tax=Panacibacter ginsenosidivorans TaxID=1813871 RepID=A0A5B8VBK6_9BACT|nr:hypothetical protein [Panacibacter ginsenosidivorans]QEC68897.1 hypothetical protein FRZ67_16860 [Panacibacter ginsenosidivorans]